MTDFIGDDQLLPCVKHYICDCLRRGMDDLKEKQKIYIWDTNKSCAALKEWEDNI